jgi:hypothetical protein
MKIEPEPVKFKVLDKSLLGKSHMDMEIDSDADFDDLDETEGTSFCSTFLRSDALAVHSLNIYNRISSK